MAESLIAPEDPKPGHGNRFVAKPTDTYVLTVDYGRTLQQMIKAGKYDVVRSEVSAKNFRYKRSSGKIKVEIVLIEFDQDISFKAALRQMTRLGYRAASLPELLALGEYLQTKGGTSIVALGSIWRDRYRTRDRVAYLKWGICRYLVTIYFRSHWPAGFRFAAVRIAKSDC